MNVELLLLWIALVAIKAAFVAAAIVLAEDHGWRQVAIMAGLISGSADFLLVAR